MAADNESKTAIALVDPLVGTIFDKRFRVEQKIAAGGFGAIYRATHVKSGHPIALKVLLPSLAQDLGVVARFRREGDTLTALRCPHTISAYELGQAADRTLFIVMELLGGENLFERYQANGPFEWKRMVRIARQVCESLAEAHERGIVHRDLKPTNIHLELHDGDPDYVKVLDFGIAKILGGSDFDASDITNAGTMIGTLDYMSPEQMVGGAVTGQTDIYTLGIVMYEMIAGTRPFPEAETAASALAAMLKTTPEPLYLRAPVPEEVSRIVMRCLDRDTAKRYRTVEDLVLDLDRLLATSAPTADKTKTVTLDTRSRRGDDEDDATTITPPPERILDGVRTPRVDLRGDGEWGEAATVAAAVRSDIAADAAADAAAARDDDDDDDDGEEYAPTTSRRPDRGPAAPRRTSDQLDARTPTNPRDVADAKTPTSPRGPAMRRDSAQLDARTPTNPRDNQADPEGPTGRRADRGPAMRRDSDQLDARMPTSPRAAGDAKTPTVRRETVADVRGGGFGADAPRGKSPTRSPVAGPDARRKPATQPPPTPDPDARRSAGTRPPPDPDARRGGVAQPDVDARRGGVAQADVDARRGGAAQADVDARRGGAAQADADARRGGAAQPDVDARRNAGTRPPPDPDARRGGVAQPDVDARRGGAAQADPDARQVPAGASPLAPPAPAPRPFASRHISTPVPQVVVAPFSSTPRAPGFPTPMPGSVPPGVPTPVPGSVSPAVQMPTPPGIHTGGPETLLGAPPPGAAYQGRSVTPPTGNPFTGQGAGNNPFAQSPGSNPFAQSPGSNPFAHGPGSNPFAQGPLPSTPNPRAQYDMGTLAAREATLRRWIWIIALVVAAGIGFLVALRL